MFIWIVFNKQIITCQIPTCRILETFSLSKRCPIYQNNTAKESPSIHKNWTGYFLEKMIEINF